jgi:membrane protease subunit HflC
MLGLERIVDKIMDLGEELLPFEVIDHYHRGLRLRFGVHVGGVLEPGFHWKWPFMDKIIWDMVKMKTFDLEEQSCTTKDWKGVVVKGVIKYEIKDIVKSLLESNGPVDSVSDMTRGIIRNAIIERDWIECNTADLGKEIREKARREAEKWGIRILEVTLTDLSESRSFRIFNSKEKNL